MNHLFVYFAAGGAFVGVLLFWALRAKSPALGSQETPESQLLDALEIRPQMMAHQIFDDRDWNFVREAAPTEERPLFLRDRKRVALIWLEEMRKQVAEVMWLHRQAARRATDLSATLELQIAANYFAFLFCWRAMQIGIHLRGPFGARLMMERLLGCSRRLWQESEQLLASLGMPRRVEVTVVEK